MAAFVITALIAALMIAWLESRQIEVHRAQVGEQAASMAHEVETQVERALTATYALAALVRQGNGSIRDFDAVATAMLPFYPGADSLQLAPGGIVTSIVPLAGNERAIGHNLLEDRSRTREAFLARDTGRLTLAGPFKLVQGGLGAVGRLPVFLDGADGKAEFWGFTSVLIRFPKALDSTHLQDMAERGIDYEIYRIHPDTQEKQLIAASSSEPLAAPVSRSVKMPNGTWTLSATPRSGWTDSGRLATKAAIGLLFCLMAARLARQMAEIRLHRSGLQVLVDQRTKELQSRQAELKQAQAVARTGSWVYDARSDRLTGSSEAHRIFGLEEGPRLDYALIESRLHPQDRDQVRQAWHSAVKGEAFDLEHRIVVDGQTRWVHTQAEMFFNGKGRMLRTIGSVQEITERRRAREQLMRL